MVFESAADKADAIIAGEDFERMTKVYIKIRDARAKAKKEFEEADSKLMEQQKTIRVAMLEKMQSNGASSIGTSFGTVYLDEQLKASAEDWMIVHNDHTNDPTL